MKIILMLLVLVGVKYNYYYLVIKVNLNYILEIIYSYYALHLLKEILYL